MEHFTVTQPLADVLHIQDAGGVCFTLLRGQKDTLLWDTGMGFFDVAECIAPYVRGRLRVVLSHGHYDHACGQHYFAASYVHSDDLKRCKITVSRKSRESILQRMRQRDFLPDDYPAEQFLAGTPNTIKPLKDFSLDLGDMEVRFMPSPGHTAGSIVAYVPQRRLFLTGDTWNPHTWLFFPESSSLAAYASVVRSLRELPADHVLRSHDLEMATMARFRAYADGLNDATFAKAEPCPVPPYTNIRTYCCYPEPQSKLVFNDNKRS